MPTVDEALNIAEKEMKQTIDDLITIDSETREIYIPDSEKLFGVMSDEKSPFI